MTAMVYASRLKSVEMATLLLSAGADVNLGPLLEYPVGTKVSVNYQNRGSWLPGIISAVRANEYKIQYNRGTNETVKRERIKLIDEDGILLLLLVVSLMLLS